MDNNTKVRKKYTKIDVSPLDNTEFMILYNFLKRNETKLNKSEMERVCEIPRYSIANCLTLNRCSQMYVSKDTILRYIYEFHASILSIINELKITDNDLPVMGTSKESNRRH